MSPQVYRQIWLAVFLVGGGVVASTVSASEISVGIPLGARVESKSGDMKWRQSGRTGGSGEELATAGFRTPGRLYGADAAESAGRAFPLPADIVRVNGQLYAVLQLDLDRYLQGVVPAEMHPGWPTEALKAQAVVARTFAVGRIRTNRYGGKIDLVAGTADQEFRWERVPPQAVAKAVEASEGLVLATRSGAIAEAFYHSCCGGYTADASEVWGKRVPGITPVEDPHCTACPNYFWNVALTPTELGGVFGIGPVAEIRVLARGPSERVTKLMLSDDRDKVVLDAMDFRRQLGAQRLHSTLFRVRGVQSPRGPRWVFQGSGSGHGAGLCQWGAKAMADEGRNFREILSHYFPRLVLKSAKDL